MRERGSGAIVNVSSTAAKRPSAGMPDYSVMKAAMLSFSRLVADLYAGTASAATPSRPARPRPRRGSATAGSPTSRASATAVLAKVGAGRPLGRLAEPEEIAAVIVFLSPSAPRTSPAPRGAPTAAPSRSSSEPTPPTTLAPCPSSPGRSPTPSRRGSRELEERALSPLAVRSYETRGRARPEDECRVRTPFQRDRDRIVHSKPFRRLKGKTQVFIDPAGDHYRTRMTHTLETTGIARVVARALRLNEDLDRGDRPRPRHGPPAVRARRRGGARRGAARARRRRLPPQRAVGADRERLNLTHEVVDGILTHTGEREPETLEGKIVRIVDRVAYINHDIDDAIRYGILDEADLPARRDRGARPDAARSASTRLVHDLVETSAEAGDIVQSDEVGAAMLSLRAFMFERVYLGPETRPEHARARDDDPRASSTTSSARGDAAGRRSSSSSPA